MVSSTCFQHHLWNNYKCNSRGKKKSFAPVAIWWGMGKLFHLAINACALYESSTLKFCNSHFFIVCLFVFSQNCRFGSVYMAYGGGVVGKLMQKWWGSAGEIRRQTEKKEANCVFLVLSFFLNVCAIFTIVCWY